MAVLMADSMAETGRPASEHPARTMVEAATRAHALLTQSLPDELLDEISASHAAHHMPFKLPAVFVG